MKLFKEEELIKDKQDIVTDKITEKRKDVKPDRADMTFGEIINMYENDEIIISPEFQRAFRWKEDRQSRFIESLLLGIPIPPIFVAETEEGIWELVDGLQRLSTVLSFFGKLKDEKKNDLVLTAGTLIPELEGFNKDTLPARYMLALKRAICRVEIIRFDSGVEMRYELFNRLNTGGVELSEQEIRNCIFRGYSNEFNAFINELAKTPEFINNIHLSDDKKERMHLEELILRYLTLKNRGTKFKHIQKHMDEYMLSISKEEENFDYGNEKKIFLRVIKKINDLNENIFDLVSLPFSTSMYDPIMVLFAKHIDYIDTLSKEEILSRVNQLKNDNEFRKHTTSSSSSKGRITKKLEIAEKYFSNMDIRPNNKESFQMSLI